MQQHETPNGVLFQFFYWHTPADGGLWRELAEIAPRLHELGVTSVWIPPCYKASGGASDPGYAVYDLFDLGEFDQKGSVRTKYGTKEELIDAVRKVHSNGIHVYADVVLNHRNGGDETEEVEAREIDRNDRTIEASAPYTMRSWTKFSFPGRGGKYSTFEWCAEHFTAVDCNADAPEEDKLYLINGKNFSEEVSSEFGNFDYLMGCDVDCSHEGAREEMFYWARWFVDTAEVDGFRLDAVKHIPVSFYRDFFSHLRTHFGEREVFGVGEYWSTEVSELQSYLSQTEGVMKLFDVPLQSRLMAASKSDNSFDMQTIFEGSLVAADPIAAVTFVDNHDTQPGQSLESWVDDWFKPIAYALILLRKDGYPCLFYADYYGGESDEANFTSHREILDVLLNARQCFNHGDQHDYFDHPNCVAWVRTGNEEHPGAMVVVVSNGDAGRKNVQTFAPNAKFRDLTGYVQEEIATDENGSAEFRCLPGSLSVWVQS